MAPPPYQHNPTPGYCDWLGAAQVATEVQGSASYGKPRQPLLWPACPTLVLNVGAVGRCDSHWGLLGGSCLEILGATDRA